MLRQFWLNTRGGTAVMFGLVLVPCMIGLGVAVDTVRSTYTKTVLQGAADVAALAGAVSNDPSKVALDAVVHDYLQANGALDVLEYVKLVKQETDSSKGTFTVTIAGEVNTSFMKLAGVSAVDLSVQSEVNLGAQALEVALVLDNTGSMSGSKIANLKTSAKALVDILDKDKSDYATLKMGIVPFSEYVNVGTAHGNAAWIDGLPGGFGAGSTWEGCVGSRPAPDDAAVGYSGGSKFPMVNHPSCTVQLTPLTSNLGAIRTGIDQMKAEGMTYVPTGLLWGWNILDNSEPFVEGMSKAKKKAVMGRKAIVLMTDGENTISADYPGHTGADIAAANAKLTEVCGAVKGDEIDIFTVSFMVSTPVIEQLLKDCASSTDYYFDADNSAELLAAFKTIGDSLSLVRLTR